MKNLRIIFFCMAITLNPGAQAGVQGYLPPVATIANYADGWISLSANYVGNPTRYNFAPLALNVVPGLLSHRVYAYFYFGSVSYTYEGFPVVLSYPFQPTLGFISGTIDLFRQGAAVGSIPVSVWAPNRAECGQQHDNLHGCQWRDSSISDPGQSVAKPISVVFRRRLKFVDRQGSDYSVGTFRHDLKKSALHQYQRGF